VSMANTSTGDTVARRYGMVNGRPRAVFPVGKEGGIGADGNGDGALGPVPEAYVVAAPFDAGNRGSIMPARLEQQMEAGPMVDCDVEFHRRAVDAIKGFRAAPFPSWGGAYFEFEGIAEDLRVEKRIPGPCTSRQAPLQLFLTPPWMSQTLQV
jgi:hypothetical protein